jgi:hypothetical protein
MFFPNLNFISLITCNRNRLAQGQANCARPQSDEERDTRKALAMHL